jgi:hypothetical protein
MLDLINGGLSNLEAENQAVEKENLGVSRRLSSLHLPSSPTFTQRYNKVCISSRLQTQLKSNLTANTVNVSTDSSIVGLELDRASS